MNVYLGNKYILVNTFAPDVPCMGSYINGILIAIDVIKMLSFSRINCLTAVFLLQAWIMWNFITFHLRRIRDRRETLSLTAKKLPSSPSNKNKKKSGGKANGKKYLLDILFIFCCFILFFWRLGVLILPFLRFLFQFYLFLMSLNSLIKWHWAVMYF